MLPMKKHEMHLFMHPEIDDYVKRWLYVTFSQKSNISLEGISTGVDVHYCSWLHVLCA